MGVSANFLIISENEAEAIRLIRSGVDANVKDRYGRSPMFLAAENSNGSKMKESSKILFLIFNQFLQILKTSSGFLSKKVIRIWLISPKMMEKHLSIYQLRKVTNYQLKLNTLSISVFVFFPEVEFFYFCYGFWEAVYRKLHLLYKLNFTSESSF